MTKSFLLEILRDQKAELESFANYKFCARMEETKINLKSNKAQVVIGVRRSGKSVLCYNALMKSNVKFAYVNFDDERLSKLKSEDLNEVLRNLYQIYGDFTHLFLDEAQNIDGWHLFVNRILRQGLKAIITGSNAKLLSSELATHLTGRYNEIKLYPFSFSEFCEIKDVKTDSYTTKDDGLLQRAFDEYLQIGGFPEIVKGEEEADPYIDQLVNNILERDIVQRFKVKYKDAFKKLANHLMNNAPCDVVCTSLQKLFNIKTDHTVENYVGYLVQGYLLIQLKKFSHKSIERIRNAKCYVVDVSLMNARKDAFAKENLGWRLETIVYLELCRRYATGYDFYYFRDNSTEADFVICHRSTVIEVIQVAFDLEKTKTFNRKINGLLKASQGTNCNKLSIITAYEERTIEVGGKIIEIKPCYRWLLNK